MQTFHVFLRRGRATHRINVMAADKADASRRAGEDFVQHNPGWIVDRVRHAPIPAHGGRPGQRKV